MDITSIKEVTIDENKRVGVSIHDSSYIYEENSIVKLQHENVPIERVHKSIDLINAVSKSDIPIAKPLGIVRCGNRFGLEYDFINYPNLSYEIVNFPQSFTLLTKSYSNLLIKIHNTKHNKSVSPSPFSYLGDQYKDILLNSNTYSNEQKDLIQALIDLIPMRETLVHGDFHPGNIIYYKDELLLFGLTDIAYGHPIYDFANLYMVKNISDMMGKDQYLFSVGLTGTQLEKSLGALIKFYFSNLSMEEIREMMPTFKFLSQLKFSVLCSTKYDYPFGTFEDMQKKLREDFFDKLPNFISDFNGIAW